MPKQRRLENFRIIAAEWDAAFINDLPDDSFAIVLPGGEKDDQGKTVPRSLRKLPYKNAAGEIDPAHLRNALSRLPQSDLNAEQRAKAQAKLAAAAREAKIGEYADDSVRGSIRASEIRKTGEKWTVTLIKAGKSLTDFFFSNECLKNSVAIFEGVPVFAHKYALTAGENWNHRPSDLDDPNGLSLNKVGNINDVRYVEKDGEGSLVGTFYCTLSALRDQLANAWDLVQRGEIPASQMLGLSIDVDARGYVQDGVRYPTTILAARSVDVVTHPAAGGRFEKLVAALNTKEGNMNLLQKLLAAVKAGTIKLDGVDVAGKSDEELLAAIQSACGVGEDGAAQMAKLSEDQIAKILALPDLAAIKAAVAEALKPAADPAIEAQRAQQSADAKAAAAAKAKADADLEKRLAALETEKSLEASQRLVASTVDADKILDAASKEHLKRMFSGRVVESKDIDAAIVAHKEYLDRMTASGAIKDQHFVVVTSAPQDKMEKALDLLIDPNLRNHKTLGAEYKGVVGFRGIQEAIETWYGNKFRCYQAFANPEIVMTAKMSTQSDFSSALGNTLNRRMLREYQDQKARQVWQQFVTETDLNDLRLQTRIQLGGFGEIDTVAEDGAYGTLTTPDEDAATYTPFKKGGLFSVTEEMVINDDIRLLRAFPVQMARAQIYTLSRFVFGLIFGRSGTGGYNAATIYDGGALYSGNHDNKVAGALTPARFDTAVQLMGEFRKNLTDEPIVATPKFLLVTPAYQRMAWDICMNKLAQSNVGGTPVSVENAYSQYGVIPLVISKEYACDNNDNWLLIADPMSVEGVEVGYYGNNREPEILLQDRPDTGDVFSRDRITYKTKFRYGGAITNWRQFVGGNL